ncbi:MAG: T9SS type A sorting domain-containing protein, partial [Mameliella sp.]|nr:T9SS type A sorting domain-containing protein [Phaeodactylibacter sp.]
QKHDYIWLQGYDSDAGEPGIEASILDFNFSPVKVDSIRTGGGFYLSSTSIADQEGVLQFYTDGCDIYNTDHQVMENGDSINPGAVHQLQCEEIGYGYTAGRQSSLILPMPGSDSLYYLFHKRIIYQEEPVFDVITDRILYSVVDMSANQGLGRVVEKNIALFEEPTVGGQLTAVKHANGEDWWVVNALDQSPEYAFFLLDNTGAAFSHVDSMGLPASYSGSRGGQANFSPDGRYYARYSADGLFLMEFDRQAGALSAFQHIPIPDVHARGGVAFSPNSELCYISAFDTIMQFDLMAPDIEASGVVVAVYDGNQELFATTFGNALLAPDCKIYINTFANVKTLHIIHLPNERGTACFVEQHALDLPFWHDKALPNFPNYRLGPIIPDEAPPPPCETVVSTPTAPLPGGPGFSLYPNPTSGFTTVAFGTRLSGRVSITLYSPQGQQVLQQTAGEGAQQVLLETAALPSGTYVCRVTGSDGVTDVKKLVKL